MIRLACAQMTSTNDGEENLAQLNQLIESKQMDLLVLPEMCFCIGNKHQQSRPLAFEKIMNEMQKIALNKEAVLIGGTIKQPQNTSNKYLACCPVFDASGKELDRYQKIHLFDVDVEDKQGAYRESDTYDHGDQCKVVQIQLEGKQVKVGLAVCYDLRFSLLFHELKKQGAHLIVVPAAFVYQTGSAHWEILLRARAIEFGVYILACNQTGWHDEKRQTFGHSMLINPW